MRKRVVTDKHRVSGAVTHKSKGRVVMLEEACLFCGNPAGTAPVYEKTQEYATKWRILFCESCMM